MVLFDFQQKFVVNNLLKNGISNDKIMVLTPYRAQIDCCKKENIVQPVEITTIHGSQGQYIYHMIICPRGIDTFVTVLLQVERVML